MQTKLRRSGIFHLVGQKCRSYGAFWELLKRDFYYDCAPLELCSATTYLKARAVGSSSPDGSSPAHRRQVEARGGGSLSVFLVFFFKRQPLGRATLLNLGDAIYERRF